MNINEATTGNRVIVSVNVIGGLRRDMTPEQVRWMLAELKDAEKMIRQLEITLFDDYTVKKRTKEKGVMSAEKATEMGAVGPTLRGSGVAQDMRMMGYAALGELDFAPVTEAGGDCWSRCRVRFLETLQSIDLIRQAAGRLPAGEIRAKVKAGRPAKSSHGWSSPGEKFFITSRPAEKNIWTGCASARPPSRISRRS
ncbi:MAG: hypothetical protein R2874_00045 [Desulfobacterales bacterium]